MASDTANFGFRKDGKDDYYSIDVVNNNLDKIDSALQKIKIEAQNKDGGNADTVDNKHANDFTEYRCFDSLADLSETAYDGFFCIGKPTDFSNSTEGQTSGISFNISRFLDVQPDKTDYIQTYVRIYFDNDGEMYRAVDVYNNEADRWTRKSLKKVSSEGHKHSAEDIEDFPESLKADGGNADTAEYAWDANKLNGKAYENFVTSGVYHTDADLNNSDFNKAYITVSNSSAVVPQTDDSKSGYWHIMFFPYNGTGGGSGTQIAMPFSGNKMYIRSADGGKWGDWENISSGDTNSGGDADTVDGKHADDFFSSKGDTISVTTASSDSGSVTDKSTLNQKGLFVSSSSYTPGDPDNNDYGSISISETAYIQGNSIKISRNYSPYDENPDETDYVTITNNSIKYDSDFDSIGEISNFKFKGDGSGLTNVNADTVGGVGIDTIQQKVSGYCQCDDWNNLTASGMYGLMKADAKNGPPASNYPFYPLVFAYSDSGVTQLAVPYEYSLSSPFDTIYMRKRHGGIWRENWVALNDDGNAVSVNKFSKKFIPAANNWYRVIKGTNSTYGCSGIFNFVADIYGYHTCVVFSASAHGKDTSRSGTELNVLNHSYFKSAATGASSTLIDEIRLATGSDDYCYIDVHISPKLNNTSNYPNAEFTFTADNLGWSFLDAFETVNTDYGTIIREITL